MNEALAQLASKVGLGDSSQRQLRLAFGLACVQRVEHLLEDDRAKAGLTVLQEFVRGQADEGRLEAVAQELQTVANRHRGSNSIDGTAHAAVSATYAVANALAGRALEAASYAAYASVYAYGGYAVTDRSAFEPELSWQVDELRRLAALQAQP
jgi:hypothetical protein